MRRVAVKIAYLGGDFSGSQIQPAPRNLRSMSIRVEGHCGDSRFCEEEKLWFSAGFVRIHVDDPRLWMPRGYGDANLYEVCVTLFVDGKQFGSQDADKIFRFKVPITGEHEISAVSGKLKDTITIRRVEKANPDYVKDGTNVLNWFDRDDEVVKDGYFSIKDSMAAVKGCPEAKKVFDELAAPLMEAAKAAYGDVAKKVQMPPEIQAMMDKMSVEATLKQIGRLVSPEFIHKLNYALNQVKKDAE